MSINQVAFAKRWTLIFSILLKLKLSKILPSVFLIKYNWSRSDFPGSNGCPEYNSQNTQPIAQTSTGGPYCVSPTSSSGARYHLVATYSVKFSFGTLENKKRVRKPFGRKTKTKKFSLRSLAKPKSHSLTTFCLVISMFSGFTSLCIHFIMIQNMRHGNKCKQGFEK